VFEVLVNATKLNVTLLQLNVAPPLPPKATVPELWLKVPPFMVKVDVKVVVTLEAVKVDPVFIVKVELTVKALFVTFQVPPEVLKVEVIVRSFDCVTVPAYPEARVTVLIVVVKLESITAPLSQSASKLISSVDIGAAPDGVTFPTQDVGLVVLQFEATEALAPSLPTQYRVAASALEENTKNKLQNTKIPNINFNFLPNIFGIQNISL
jgi:hypothetical protein